MSNQQSLADMAVETLAAVKAMDNGANFENPERHAVRNMKRIAEQIIENALRQARMLAFEAESVREACKEAAQPNGEA